MSIFRRPRAEPEARTMSVPFNVGGSGLTAGGNIGDALRLAPVYSACTLIVDGISTMPLHAYQGRAVAAAQPQLVDNPGESLGLDRIAWLGQVTLSMLLRGNAYGLPVAWDARGTVAQVKWLHPDTVTVDEAGAKPEYRVAGRVIPAGLMIHVSGICPPGSVVGLNLIELFRAEVETGRRAGDLARRWMAEGVAPSGILFEKTRALMPGEAAQAKARLKEAIKDHDVLVTGNDWGYLPLSVNPADAMFLEQIKASATVIASIFHVAPEDIGGESGSSMTYSTLESNDLRHQRRAILPTARRIESAITRLLPGTDYARFNLDATVRTELKTRLESYAIALDNGILTLDEVRALEDRDPLTAEQHAAWQADYVVPRPNGAGDTAGARKLAAAEVAQKIYLAAGGRVLTTDEGRKLLSDAGLPLDPIGSQFDDDKLKGAQ